MKKIIYIDNEDSRRDEIRILRDRNDLRNLLDCYKTVKDESGFFHSYDNYGVIFVHQQNNDYEEFFSTIKDKVPLASFSGGYTGVPHIEGITIYLNYSDVKQNIIPFLKYYKENNGAVELKKLIGTEHLVRLIHTFRHDIINVFSPFFLRVDSLIRKNKVKAFKGCDLGYLVSFREIIQSKRNIAGERKLDQILDGIRDIVERTEGSDQFQQLVENINIFFGEGNPFSKVCREIRGEVGGKENPEDSAKEHAAKWCTEAIKMKKQLNKLYKQWNTDVKASLNEIIKVIEKKGK